MINKKVYLCRDPFHNVVQSEPVSGKNKHFA